MQGLTGQGLNGRKVLLGRVLMGARSSWAGSQGPRLDPRVKAGALMGRVLMGKVLMGKALMGKVLVGARSYWASSYWAHGLNGQGHRGKVIGGTAGP